MRVSGVEAQDNAPGGAPSDVTAPATATTIVKPPTSEPQAAVVDAHDPKDLVVTKTVTTTVRKTDAPGAQVVHTDLPADLSVTGMFAQATIVVKIVMGILAAASVVTWAIWIYKSIEIGSARARVQADLRSISKSGTLGQVSSELNRGPVARLAQCAILEMEASENLPNEGVKERVAIGLQRVESAAARRISIGTGILASVGSTGPFVGLFGTVWGIMNSFIHISNSHTTNLSVVAPGIAEALLATAMGLVAAIPAVVIYNMFSRAIASYRALLGDASAGIMRHVSRDLDRIDAGHHAPIAAE